jgi:predicted transcriptional regulator
MLYKKIDNQLSKRVSMHRSKLELYEEMLQALAKKPLSIDSLAYKCNMDCVLLSQRLTFLAKNDLIQQGTCKGQTVYALTKRGLAISKTLAITRRLEKLQTAKTSLGDAVQALPALSGHSEGKAKRTRRSENY